MGELPIVFLVLVSLGVTYGWQPDQANPSGTTVEYIVQVSPSELDQFSQGNPITSVIDPQVRGHVSKVVVRVGTAPLPRTIPPMLAADRVAVRRPDPQSGGRTQFNIPNSLQESAENAARDAAQGARSTLNQAGRELGNQLNQQLQQGINNLRGNVANDASGNTRAGSDTGRIAPRFPSTASSANPPNNAGSDATSNQPRFPFGSPNRQNNSLASPSSQLRQGQLRQDQGSSSNLSAPSFATTRQPDSSLVDPSRAGGNRRSAPANLPSTTSTERDNRWNPFSGRRPSDVSSRNTAANNPNAGTGLRTADRFGRTNVGTTNASAGQRGLNDFGRNDPNSPVLSQFEQTQLDRQRRSSGASLGIPQQNGPALNRPQQNQTASSAAISPQFGSPRSGIANQSQNRALPNTLARRDPSLTPSQIAAGGWGFDQFGNLLDRQGRRIDPPGLRSNTNRSGFGDNPVANNPPFADPRGGSAARSPGSQFAAAQQQGGNFAQSSVGIPAGNPGSFSNPTMQQQRGMPNSFGANPRGFNPQQAAMFGANPFGAMMAAQNGFQGNMMGPTGYPASAGLGTAQFAANRGPAPISQTTTTASSASDRTSSTESSSGSKAVVEPRDRKKPSKNQFLFNTLFMASCMGNVFLVMYLKNVYFKLREMVGASRVQSSNVAA